jgi:argininosuccinate lyase
MRESAKGGFTNATDVADYLVNKGMPFRDAHSVSGRLVLLCIEKGCALDDLSMEEYKVESELFDKDIYAAISLETCVNKRVTLGAPGKSIMEKVIQDHRVYLNAK